MLKAFCILAGFGLTTLFLSERAEGQTFESLYSFGFNTTQVTGELPNGTLAQGSDGNFYGLARSGGPNQKGTIFRFATNGTVTLVAAFNGTNGSTPVAGLIRAGDGNFYGTTYLGGTSNLGTMFRATANGTFLFQTSLAAANGNNPRGSLAEGNDGSFYGTTRNGGANSAGTVFQITTNGILMTIASLSDGVFPQGGLLLGSNGDFYGVTEIGGLYNGGTIFKATTSGVVTTLASFNNPITGGLPHAGLAQGVDGNFYGTTSQFGPRGYGTLFQITPGGKLTVVTAFGGTIGDDPEARLVTGSDGNLYGTTTFAARPIYGTIFRIVMPVALNFKRRDGDVIVSWRTNAAGFTLQTAAEPGSPSGWIDSTNLPVENGGEFVVTNSISGSTAFYRLKK